MTSNERSSTTISVTSIMAREKAKGKERESLVTYVLRWGASRGNVPRRVRAKAKEKK